MKKTNIKTMAKLSDNCPMPWGKYKGEQMQDVPAWYLWQRYDSGACTADVSEYVVENLDVIKQQAGIK